MTAPTLTWVWADGPHPARGNSTTIAVTTTGERGYSYYHRTDRSPWTLIAVADNERQAVNWYNHRVDRVDAPSDVAAQLDALAAAAGGAR